jgi:hypothetical protein
MGFNSGFKGLSYNGALQRCTTMVHYNGALQSQINIFKQIKSIRAQLAEVKNGHSCTAKIINIYWSSCKVIIILVRF